MPRRRNVTKYRENPFLKHTAELSITGYKKITSPTDPNKFLIVDPNTGEGTPAGFYFRKEVEKNEFVKIYAEGAAALMDLKTAGTKVFQLVYGQLFGKAGKDKTEIVLNYELLNDKEQKFLSRRTFERGITELIKAGFIAESIVASYYYINPAFLYNGNRLALVNEYVLKSTNSNGIPVIDNFVIVDTVDTDASSSFETQLESRGQQELPGIKK